LAVNDQALLQVVPLIQERMVTLDDSLERGGFFFQDTVAPNPTDLVAKGLSAAQSATAARKALAVLESLPDFNRDHAEAPLRALADEMEISAGQLFGILRVAITGQTVSPPLMESMDVIGKSKVIERMHNAIHILDNMTGPDL